MTAYKKPETLLAQLKQFEIFQPIDDEALCWLIQKSDYRHYEKGDSLFQPGQPVDYMQIIMEGKYIVEIERKGQRKDVGVWSAGYITGILPFSRMKETRAYGTALEPTYTLELHRDHFTEMVNVSYELVQALVAVMSTRIRDFSQMRFQDEKIMALGKMSAGLAHELNNPASAMVRSSEILYERIHATPEKFKNVITMRITPEQTDRVNALMFGKLKEVDSVELSIMEREERFDDLYDWLEDHDADDPDCIADTLVDYGWQVEDLEKIKEIVEGKSLSPILHWIESTLTLEKLVNEIRESADRIAGLIKSIKSYSHMDRASTMESLDIHEGLRSTLVMLKHKLKDKNIQVVKELIPDLPPVQAMAGEINQVWTNLIDNAIDAMEPGGTLTLSSHADTDRDRICVDITDTGSGISEEDQIRIFDPFFTTKAMGEGTGIGLDIVKKIMDRHQGDISILESQPGKTTFRVCFPIWQKS